jgi:hypothetical protein
VAGAQRKIQLQIVITHGNAMGYRSEGRNLAALSGPRSVGAEGARGLRPTTSPKPLKNLDFLLARDPAPVWVPSPQQSSVAPTRSLSKGHRGLLRTAQSLADQHSGRNVKNNDPSLIQPSVADAPRNCTVV